MSVFHLISSFIEYQTNSSMKKKKQLTSTTKTNKMKVISRKNCSVTEIKHPHDEDHSELEGWQSKNDPLIFRPFLKVSTCQNSTTSEHFQKWLKNQGIVLALSPPIKPLTPKISLLVLLTVSQMILIMLVWRIWYWINK